MKILTVDSFADITRAAMDERTPKAKRRKGTSPTARTLAELRKRGWTAQVVERPWNKFSKVTLDLFGVIDLIAIVPPDGDILSGQQLQSGAILGIQATGHITGGGNHAARRTKILAEPRAAEWVAAGGRLELWSWSKRGAAGKRKLWTLRVETYAEMCVAANGEMAF